jgi:hypothetical protein
MGELHFRLKCTPIQSVHSGRIIGAEIVTSCGVVCAGSQCTTTLLELLYGLAFKKRERDRRFALPRWWSGGDSNCRSSLRSIYSGKVVTREISTRPFQKIREAFLRRVSSTARLNRAIFQQSPTSKRPKRDRRFESPPLHQRGSANRRSVPGFEKVETILRWDFDRVIVSHGNLLEGDGRARVRALSPICGRRSLSSRKSEVQCKIRLRSRRQDAP